MGIVMEQSDTEFQRLEVTVGWGHKHSKVKFQIRRIKGKEEEGHRRIHKSEVVFGRSIYKSDYIIPHALCSNRHFRLYCTIFEEGSGTPPMVFCEDLGGANKTYVNGRELSREGALLFPGDCIEISCAASITFNSSFELEPLDQQTVLDQQLFASKYQLTKAVLGTGAYGRVLCARDVVTGHQVACKIIEMTRYMNGKSNAAIKAAWDRALREVHILSELNHKNIINILHVVKTNKRIYIFQELITHGDLFSKMVASEVLREVEAYPIVWQILKALTYLHSRGIVHRDLKPENILCASGEHGGRIVLADFGTARRFTEATRLSTITGTHEFAAPEVNPKGYGYSNEVDLWSLGVIVHNLIIPRCSHMASPHELKLLFERGDFSHFARTNVSALAKDFIKRLLCTNPQRRLTATQAMKHPWLSRLADDLNDLYERSTENWKGRIGTVTIDSFVKPGFGAPPGPVRVPSIIYEEPVPSNTEYNTENEEVEISNLESSGTKEAYDNVAGDGKLRTAAQLAQKANDKRAIITKANPQKVITLGPKRKRDMVETVTRNKMSFLRLDSGEKSQYFSNLSRG